MTDAPTAAASPVVSALYRYPVKGLSAEELVFCDVKPDEAFPYDRAWAIENGPSRFSNGAKPYLAKTSFLMLMRDARLATLETVFDQQTCSLTIHRAGRPVCRGDLTTKSGRAIIEQFFAAFMEKSLRGPPRIVHTEGHSFSDREEKCVHVANRASIRELENEAGRAIDPIRFRANLIIDGAEPRSELGWIGRTLVIGSARLEVFARTGRCAATNVDPRRGARDMDIPAVIARRWGHTDFGVYARVTAGGRIAPGAAIEIE